MSDPLLDEMLMRRGHGRPLRALPLRGRLRLRDGGEAPAYLVLTERGLFLAGVAGAGVGAVEGGLLSLPLRYRSGVLGDELSLDGRTFGVPPGKSDEARHLIALARYPGEPYEGLAAARHIEPPTELEARWLGAALEEGEVLLAWLETAESALVPSEIFEEKRPVRFLLTSERAALVALSSVGDALVRWLPAAPPEVRRASGRDVHRAGDLEWTPPLFLQGLFEELLPVFSEPPAARILEVTRLNHAHRDKRKECRAAAKELLSLLVLARDPLAVVLAALLEDAVHEDLAPNDDDIQAALRALIASGEGAGRLAKAWRGFSVGIEGGMGLLERLLGMGESASAFAVELHAALREALLESADDGFAEAALDIAYAEHLLRAGRPAEAEVVLEARIAALPSEELADLLPPSDADLSEGASGQRFRLRILELLAEARGRGDERHGPTLGDIARLQPLVPQRLSALVEAGGGHEKAAAAKVLSVLERGGLAPLDPRAEEPPDTELRALPRTVLFDVLQHPAAREGHVLGKLQGFLASQKAPDHSALQAYCERFERGGVAERALSDASLVLGVPAVAGYVSRGDRAVGIRAYDAPVPFLLVGGRHLEEGSDFWLHPWELRFAIAAEVAHLRFRHTRVTADEVWAGAFEKGRLSVDVLLGMLPVFRGVHVVDKVWAIIERYKKGPLGRVLQGVNVAERAVTKTRGARPAEGRPREQPIAEPNERLVVAHRVMQLTADRAGLLLAGDLGAAIRSMFLSTHAYRAELPVAERHGLLAVLGRRDDAGDVVFQDLAVRISALVSFFLSDDHARLKDALAGLR